MIFWTWDRADKKHRAEADALADNLQREGAKAAARLDLRLAALQDKRWRESPVAPKLADKARAEYAATIEGLRGQLKAKVDEWVEALADMDADRIKLSGEWQRRAFIDVPQGAADTFAARLATMPTGEVVATYKHGADWQRAVIAAHWRKPAVNPEHPMGTDPDVGELARLIEAGPSELKGRGFSGGETVKAIPTPADVDEFGHYVAALSHKSGAIDHKAYRASLRDRFGVGGEPERFDAQTIEGESLRMLREYQNEPLPDLGPVDVPLAMVNVAEGRAKAAKANGEPSGGDDA